MYMQRSQQRSTMTTPHPPSSAFHWKIDALNCPLLISLTTHKEEERKEEEANKKQNQEEEKETTGEADIEPSFSFVIVDSKDEDGKPWEPPNHVSPVNAPRFSSASLVERVAMQN
jgi:hypothetical protein